MRPAIFQEIERGGCPDIDALVRALAPELPLLRALVDTPQDPEWHAEGDVHVHTGMVLDELYQDLQTQPVDPTQRLVMVLGALLHDIAKPLTTRAQDFAGVRRVVAPRHEARGRSLLPPSLLRWGLSWAEIEGVMGLVGAHHEPKLLIKKDRGHADYWRVARMVDPTLLYRVESADMRGRHCRDKQEQLDILDLYQLYADEHGAAGWWQPWVTHFQQLSLPSPEARDLALGEAIRLAEAGQLVAPEAATYLSYGRKAVVPELVVTVGPSGAGKSTWIQRHLPDFTVISLDALREAHNGTRADQSHSGEVRQEAKELLKSVLRRGGKAVWDATSLRRDFRAPLCQLGLDYGALVTLVVFARTPQRCLARNQSRAHPVPPDVLQRQFDTYEWPEPSEAHRLLVVGEQGEVLSWQGSCQPAPPWYRG